MKKITFLFLLSISFSFGQVLIDENFDAGLTIPAGWTNNDIASGGAWTFETGGEAPFFLAGNTYLYDFAGFSGNYAMFNSDAYGNDGIAENAALESPVFDCSGLSVVKLSFDHFVYTNYGGEGHVEVYNGTSWVEVALYDQFTVPAPDYYAFGSVIIDVSTELAGVSNAQVRFRWEGDWSLFWAIDNVLVQQPTGNAPDAAINPTPANGATNVTVTVDGADKLIPFSWDAATTGDPATSTNISLGLTPAGDDIGTLTSFNSGNSIIFDWQPTTTYYWYITSVNINGTTDSQVWSFTTDNSLGIHENQMSNTFSVYPNPATDILNIKTALNIDQITVYNQLGQNVLEVKGSSLKNNAMDVSSLQAGVYLVEISAEGKNQTIKVIKK